MNLRQARKIDPGGWQRRPRRDKDKRPWWTVYTLDQFARAEARLRRSWSGRNPVIDGARDVDRDFFAMNRVNAKRMAQGSMTRFSPSNRAREKQASRDQDAAAIASGEKTAAQVSEENGSFAFPGARIRLPRDR